MESEEFMLLPVNQLVDIISSDELNVRSEEQVYNAVLNWVKFNIAERRSHLPVVIFSLAQYQGTYWIGSDYEFHFGYEIINGILTDVSFFIYR